MLVLTDFLIRLFFWTFKLIRFSEEDIISGFENQVTRWSDGQSAQLFSLGSSSVWNQLMGVHKSARSNNGDLRFHPEGGSWFFLSSFQAGLTFRGFFFTIHTSWLITFQSSSIYSSALLGNGNHCTFFFHADLRLWLICGLSVSKMLKLSHFISIRISDKKTRKWRNFFPFLLTWSEINFSGTFLPLEKESFRPIGA